MMKVLWDELMSCWSRLFPTIHLNATGMGSSHIYQLRVCPCAKLGILF